MTYFSDQTQETAYKDLFQNNSVPTAGKLQHFYPCCFAITSTLTVSVNLADLADLRVRLQCI
jgi:hypothetical protein